MPRTLARPWKVCCRGYRRVSEILRTGRTPILLVFAVQKTVRHRYRGKRTWIDHRSPFIVSGNPIQDAEGFAAPAGGCLWLVRAGQWMRRKLKFTCWMSDLKNTPTQ